MNLLQERLDSAALVPKSDYDDIQQCLTVSPLTTRTSSSCCRREFDIRRCQPQAEAMRLGLKYDVYSGLDGLDFKAILPSTMAEDGLEKLDGSRAADPSSILSAG